MNDKWFNLSIYRSICLRQSVKILIIKFYLFCFHETIFCELKAKWTKYKKTEPIRTVKFYTCTEKNVWYWLYSVFWDLRCRRTRLESPIVFKCFVVIADSAIVSPIASWKAALAPVRNNEAWCRYCMKYSMCPISWWTVHRSLSITDVHIFILQITTSVDEVVLNGMSVAIIKL